MLKSGCPKKIDFGLFIVVKSILLLVSLAFSGRFLIAFPKWARMARTAAIHKRLIHSKIQEILFFSFFLTFLALFFSFSSIFCLQFQSTEHAYCVSQSQLCLCEEETNCYITIVVFSSFLDVLLSPFTIVIHCVEICLKK